MPWSTCEQTALNHFFVNGAALCESPGSYYHPPLSKSKQLPARREHTCKLCCEELERRRLALALEELAS